MNTEGPIAADVEKDEAQDAPAPKQRNFGDLAWQFCTGTVLIFWAVWLIGQLLRDRTFITAQMFYIPSPVVALALLVTAAAAALLRRWHRFGIALVLACVPLYFVLAVENRWLVRLPEPRTDRPLKLVHWNVCRGKMQWQRVPEAIRRERADLYVLSEVPGDAELDDLASAAGTGYATHRFGGMCVIARGRLSQPHWLVRRDWLEAWTVRWQWREHNLDLMGADVISSLGVARGPLLRELMALTVEAQPDILVGDFNAPRRSRALCPLPDGYRHAYNVAGRGWAYTWPAPVSLLAIDHCIVAPRIRPLRYELASTAGSDHRLQRLLFEMQRTDP